jgi:hypothetical protein
MTGAKNFMTGGHDLTFRLPSNFAHNGINCVVIRHNAMDTYDMEFIRIRGTKVTTIEYHEGVYADQLCAIFESATKLTTAMPKVVFEKPVSLKFHGTVNS